MDTTLVIGDNVGSARGLQKRPPMLARSHKSKSSSCLDEISSGPRIRANNLTGLQPLPNVVVGSRTPPDVNVHMSTAGALDTAHQYVDATQQLNLNLNRLPPPVNVNDFLDGQSFASWSAMHIVGDDLSEDMLSETPLSQRSDLSSDSGLQLPVFGSASAVMSAAMLDLPPGALEPLAIDTTNMAGTGIQGERRGLIRKSKSKSHDYEKNQNLLKLSKAQ